MALLLGICLDVSAASPAQGNIEGPLIVTQVPRGAQPNLAGGSSVSERGRFFDHARLVLVNTNLEVRPLLSGFQGARDPDVSFDGKRVLFAGLKEREQTWRIYELNIESGHVRPVTPKHLNASHPIYVSVLFTLDSPEPWYTAVFVGDENYTSDSGATGISRLYNIRLDGDDLRTITHNPGQSYDPFQMWDGRLIYAAERYSDKVSVQQKRIGLFAVHTEGADIEFFGGSLGGPVQHMACATESGAVVFVEPDPEGKYGAGSLGCLEEARPHVTYSRLDLNGIQQVAFPTPIGGSRILVSAQQRGQEATTGIFVCDVSVRSSRLVFDDPEYNDVQVRPLRARVQPDGHSTIVNTKLDSGVLYGLNCYDSAAFSLPTGTVHSVRLLEGVPQHRLWTRDRGPWTVSRRLVGEAPVEADGSFNVEVPSDIPLLLQALDTNGLALKTCGWIWVKPKESRGCIGCHEDPERTPENSYVLALRRPSNRLVVPPEQRRLISFLEDIAPIFARHCAAADCHGETGQPLLAVRESSNGNGAGADQSRRLYQELLAEYVDPGRARTSWLIWQLLGTNTSRAGDPAKATPSRTVKHMPPLEARQRPDQAELRTIIQWIDMGAPFSSSEIMLTDDKSTRAGVR